MGIKEYLEEKEKKISENAKKAVAGVLATSAILTGATACIKDPENDNPPIVDIELKTPEDYVNYIEDKIQEKIPDFVFDELRITSVDYESGMRSFMTFTCQDVSSNELNSADFIIDEEEKLEKYRNLLKKKFNLEDEKNFDITLSLEEFKDENNSDLMKMVKESFDENSDYVLYMIDGEFVGNYEHFDGEIIPINPNDNSEINGNNDEIVEDNEIVEAIENKIQETIPNFNLDNMRISITELARQDQYIMDSVYITCSDKSSYNNETQKYDNQVNILLVEIDENTKFRNYYKKYYGEAMIIPGQMFFNLNSKDMNGSDAIELMKLIQEALNSNENISYTVDGKPLDNEENPSGAIIKVYPVQGEENSPELGD